MHGMWQDNTQLTTALEFSWPTNTAYKLCQDCALSLLYISFPSLVQFCTGGRLARPLHMQVSKLEVKLRPYLLPTGHLPSFESGTVGSTCTWFSGDRHVLGGADEKPAASLIPTLTNTSSQCFLPTPVFLLEATGKGEGTLCLTVERSGAIYLSLSNP